ncbi:protein translocase subunit SecF [Candidatus Marinamargulisbacteria bacterium SCGC AG-410-N11]|nr:protein translocase subunit SecF [Candidatus Marinamargulisbacteria bacterium SCGC AG-410-N11]
MSKFNFKIIEKKNLWFLISIIIITVGIGSMILRGINNQPILNYGIDFIGGQSMLLNLQDMENLPNDHTTIIKNIRTILEPYQLDKSSIQLIPDTSASGKKTLSLLIKMLKLNNETSQSLLTDISNVVGPIEVLEIDYIGATIGSELRKTSFTIILVVSLCLLLYISFRFKLSYGLSALCALIHDALITISFASIFNLEINTAFVAAILTILGYSINDTIVIFDRVREYFHKFKKTQTINNIINLALNDTLIRTINTSLTTLLVLLSLIYFGGSTTKQFCTILLIGVLAGTYSSLFIASPVLVKLHPEITEEENDE